MIKVLLGKIEGLFNKDFLFASFLPSLVFLGGVGVTLAKVVGFDAVWVWIGDWTALQKATVSTVGGVGIVVFAYILFGLRTVLLRLWSGMIGGPLIPFFWLGEAFNGWRYRRLRERVFSTPVWGGMFDWFWAQVDPLWDANKPPIPQQDYQDLMRAVEGLHEGMSNVAVRELLTDRVVEAFRLYSGNGPLETVYRTVREKLENWENQERIRIATERAKLDRRFGSPESIRGTALGNVVESYNVYPSKRYGMEGEVFWPHLQYVIRDVVKSEFISTIQDFRILLDFSLTMASLGVLFAVLAALVGPWLWLDARMWIISISVPLLVSYVVYYRMAVFVATQYGDVIRASFDLFRLHLLRALWRQHPVSRSAELEMWKQLSQLVVFGQVQDFEVRPFQP